MTKLSIEEYKAIQIVELDNGKFFLQDGWFNNGGASGTLHPTLEDAENYRSCEISRAESNARFIQKEKEREEKESLAEKEMIESYGGFLSDNPMKAGKQRKTLERKFRYNGEPMMRKEIIERGIKDGRFINGNRLETQDGTFYEMNKTETEYAEFLFEKREKIS